MNFINWNSKGNPSPYAIIFLELSHNFILVVNSGRTRLHQSHFLISEVHLGFKYLAFCASACILAFSRSGGIWNSSSSWCNCLFCSFSRSFSSTCLKKLFYTSHFDWNVYSILNETSFIDSQNILHLQNILKLLVKDWCDVSLLRVPTWFFYFFIIFFFFIFTLLEYFRRRTDRPIVKQNYRVWFSKWFATVTAHTDLAHLW